MGSSVSQTRLTGYTGPGGFRKEFPAGFPATRLSRCSNPANVLSFLLTLSAASAFLLSFFGFLDFYKLQPHHLPGNAIFYLSCYVTFMEAYIGIRPTRETFARFFALRINSVQGLDIPKPKPPVQCGSCIIGSRQASPFFKFSGLESCRSWQGTFFYVKNTGAADLIDLPPFDPAPPTKTNWSYNPKESHNETNRIIRFMKQRMKDTDLCSDDIIRTFISRRVLPLKRRAHKMSEMYGPGDPTKITGLPLSKKDVVLKARQICQTSMPEDWEWGLRPLSSTNPPTQEAKDHFPGSNPTSEAVAGSAVSTTPRSSLAPGLRALPARPGPRLLLLTPVRTIWRRNISASPLGHNKFGARGPYTADPRAEEDLASPPETQDTGASHMGAGRTCRAGGTLCSSRPREEEKEENFLQACAGSFRAGYPPPPPPKLCTAAATGNLCSRGNRAHANASTDPELPRPRQAAGILKIKPERRAERVRTAAPQAARSP
ncbi:hypothetical protein QYE76_053958 [Lolium multiflorum]|uniref:Transposase (putative) gypsy type domain-containing protein n=1 Tax=Lolium multiflorum TaxID=4521 RepID=A0AAD8WKK3_LOLMU|nr:hypothetical protein QYE76_053958 [Lolium multiflorum]